jgi:hypothetical protein
MYDILPSELIQMIYEFDPTYREIYNRVMNELKITMYNKKYGPFEPPPSECFEKLCVGVGNLFLFILSISISPFILLVSPCLCYDLYSEIKHRN